MECGIIRTGKSYLLSLPNQEQSMLEHKIRYVETIDELKKIIQENPVKDGYVFQSAWCPVPKIPLKIGDNDFASLP